MPGTELKARLISEFFTTGISIPVLCSAVANSPVMAMSVVVFFSGAVCGRLLLSAKASLSAVGVVASTVTQSKAGTSSKSLRLSVLSFKVLVKYTLSLPLVSSAVMN